MPGHGYIILISSWPELLTMVIYIEFMSTGLEHGIITNTEAMFRDHDLTITEHSALSGHELYHSL